MNPIPYMLYLCLLGPNQFYHAFSEWINTGSPIKLRRKIKHFSILKILTARLVFFCQEEQNWSCMNFKHLEQFLIRHKFKPRGTSSDEEKKN